MSPRPNLGREEERRGPGPGHVEREQLALPRIASAAQQAGVRIRAMREQRLHERPIAAENRRVQRGVPRSNRVRIGASVEQQRGQRAVAAVRRHDERTRAGRRGVVRVGARRQQQFHGRKVAAACRQQQGREPTFFDHDYSALAARAGGVRRHHGTDARTRVHVGTRIQQRLDHLDMPLRRGPHQRGLSLCRLPRVHVGAVSQQRLHRANAAGPRGGHQGGLAARQHRARRCAGCQQHPNHRCVPVLARQVKRCDAQLVRSVRQRARRNEPFHRLEIVQVGRPMQRGRTVRLPRVHVDRFIQ